MAKLVDDLLWPIIERTGALTVVTDDAQGIAPKLRRGSDPKVRFVHGRLELVVDLSAPGAMHVTGELERQRTVRRWARGRCLDLCAGFAGYGLQLAEAGAAEVVLVDEQALLSSSVFDDAKRNEINVRIERIEADPLGWLRAESSRPRFDVVVFHPRAVDDGTDTAAMAQKAIDQSALCLKLLDEGGILAASSSSLGLDDDAFATAMQDAAAKSRKRLQILARLGHGPDHPTLAGAPPPPSLLVARVLATA